MTRETELLDSCPACGCRILTPPLNHVRELVVNEIRDVGGFCPECNETILVTPSEAKMMNARARRTRPGKSKETAIAALNLAVRTRRELLNLKVRTIADLVQHPRHVVSSLITEYPADMLELENLVSEIGLHWD